MKGKTKYTLLAVAALGLMWKGLQLANKSLEAMPLNASHNVASSKQEMRAMPTKVVSNKGRSPASSTDSIRTNTSAHSADIAESHTQKKTPLSNEEKEMLEKDLEAYEAMLDFPSSSHPVDGSKTADPLSTKFNSDVKLASSPKNPALQLKAWASKNYYYAPDEKIELYATVFREGKEVPANIQATIVDKENVQLAKLNYIPVPGQNSLYKAVYSPTLGDSDSKIINAQIEATPLGAPKNDANTVTAYNSMLVNQVYTVFKGQIREETDLEKNLAFKASYDIKKKGTYLVEASLYDDRNNLIATFENAVQLTPGIQWVPITFYGYIFYKNHLDGPFILKHISTSYVKEDLSSIKGQLVTTDHKTSTYTWQEFNQIPYNNQTVRDHMNQISSNL